MMKGFSGPEMIRRRKNCLSRIDCEERIVTKGLSVQVWLYDERIVTKGLSVQD